MSAQPTLAHLAVYPVALPMIRSFRFASGSAGEAGGTAPHLFVRVEASDGAYGWGEGRPMPQWSYETLHSALSTLQHYLAPALQNHPVTDLIGAHRKMRAAIGRGPSSGMPIAKAALDMALHDLNARRLGLPLREFLGGSRTHREIELSWTITAHDAKSLPADYEAGRKLGFRHFNFKPAVTPATDRLVAEYLCSHRPEGGFVWADANQGYTLPAAKTAANVFASLGVHLLEQPLPANQLQLMQALRATTPLPLAIDEASVDPADFFTYAARQLVDYLVVKITRSGGLLPSQQQIAVAQAAGLPIVLSGLTDALLTKVAACQLCAAYDFSGPAALNGSQFLDESALFPDKAEHEDGPRVLLNDQPGLGLEPDLKGLKKLHPDQS